MESEWEHSYFLGVHPSTTENIIGNNDDVFSCATMRRLQEDKAFDTSVIKGINMRYKDYIIEGARSSPVEVRPPTLSTQIADLGEAMLKP